jgi:glycosyltransferase involved in cell wall biosynthesis
MLSVTVVIPVKNEAANLPECLSRLENFGHAIVVDSGSTDATIQIAKDAGAEVLHFEWDGRFPKKRNWVLRHYEFKTEWVLFLDADEFITPRFVEELLVQGSMNASKRTTGVPWIWRSTSIPSLKVRSERSKRRSSITNTVA